MRRLYRVRSVPGAEWDYLAYLEMQPEDVAHVREHLAHLRDRKQNPLRTDVVREVELLDDETGGRFDPGHAF